MDTILINLAIIISLGLIFSRFFIKAGIPGLLGLIFLGMIIGPYGLNLIDRILLDLATELRTLALIVILLRAGLGLRKESIRKVGVPALKMSFLPSILEGFAIIVVAQPILGLSFVEAGMLGFILAAASPAIIISQMLSFIKQRKGIIKGIPSLIMAGCAVDDVIAITLFSVFLGFYTKTNFNIYWQIAGIPLSLIMASLIGFLIALFLLKIFQMWKINDSEKVLLILAFAILFKGLGDLLQGRVPIAGLLGVMVIGFVLVDRNPNLGFNLSLKFSKIWLLAEIILFVLVGAQVNIQLSIEYAWIGLLVIGLGLLARSLGVYLSLIGTEFNLKEKAFCMISYTPKATVQAAIGPLPLAAGVISGDIILAISVLAILFTAPLGSMAIKLSGQRFLQKQDL